MLNRDSSTEIKTGALRFRCSPVLLLVLALAIFPGDALADIQFSSVNSPGEQTRNSDGEYGGRFWNMSGAQVTITQLGRWVRTGNTGTHTLKMYDSSNTVVGSVVVNCSGAKANDFVWGTLPNPVVVPVGAIYRILSTEQASGDSFHWAWNRPDERQDAPYQAAIGVFMPSYKSNGGFVDDSGGYSWSYGPISFKYSSPVVSWTKSGKIYATDGSPYQLRAAMMDAAAGDTVMVPAGTFTWGTNNTKMQIKDGVTIKGAGSGRTIINLDPSVSDSYTATLITLGNGSSIQNMTFLGPSGPNPDPTKYNGVNFASVGNSTGWRISGITYTQAPGADNYFVQFNGTASGLIDNCTVTGGAGNSELIFGRGRDDSWQTEHSMGKIDNIFVEDCTFNGPGYVSDANSNARMVVRFNTITGKMKVDGHGLASNGGPARGVRHMEVYGNTWTSSDEAWPAIEIRGGTGMIFGNRSLNAMAYRAWFFLTDYGYTAPWPNFGSVYQTPTNYPVKDQIGVGKDPKVAGAEPMYLWDNLSAASLGAGSATVDWALQWKAIPQEAIDRYRTQTGDSAATFHMTDVIKADRDYFKHTHDTTFNGSSGVGIGTRAQMLTIKGTKTGVGFWVTDEGEWNTKNLGPDGRLYVWDGNAWVLKYTPFSYPHPARGPAAPSALRKVGK